MRKCTFMVVLLTIIVMLVGCGEVKETDAYKLTNKYQCQKSDLLENCQFSMPDSFGTENATYVSHYTDEMIQGSYYSFNRTSCSYLNYDQYYVAALTTDKTEEELYRELESELGIRLMDMTEQVNYEDPYTRVKKTVSSCSAQVLLSPVLYGNYTGYISLITKGDVVNVLFSGTKDSVTNSKVLRAIVDSFTYTDYDTKWNHGNQKSVVSNIEDTVNETRQLNVFVPFKPIYRGEDADTMQAAIALSYVTEDVSSYEEQIHESVYRYLPTLEQNKKWVICEFRTNWQGYDVNRSLPGIPFRVSYADGTKGSALTLFQDKDKLIVALPMGNQSMKLEFGKSEPFGKITISNQQINQTLPEETEVGKGEGVDG